MGSRWYPPSTVAAFWDQIRAGVSTAEAAAAVGVSEHAGRSWVAQRGGVKPRLSKLITVGPRPRLTQGERVEIQVGVGRNESLRSIGRRLGRPASTIKRELEVASGIRCKSACGGSGFGG